MLNILNNTSIPKVLINHYTELLPEDINSELTVEKSYHKLVNDEVSVFFESGLIYVESIVFFDDFDKLKDAVTGSIIAFHNLRNKKFIDYSVMVGVREFTDIYEAISVYRELESKFHFLNGVAFYDDGEHSKVNTAIEDNPDIQFLAILDASTNKANYNSYEHVHYRYNDRTFNMNEYNSMGVKAAFMNSTKAINASLASEGLKKALIRVVDDKKIYFDEFRD